ncbi:MAG: WD40 repeat domain-containing protein [Planctomycetota bacterium]
MNRIEQWRREYGRYFGGCLLLWVSLTSAASATEPPITALAFAPGGESIVAVSQDGVQVFSWPALTRKRTIEISTPNLHCLAFSPDGKHVAVGGGRPSEEGVVEVLSWPAGQLVATLDDHQDSIRSVGWVDESRLMTTSIDHEIKRWNLENKTEVRTFRGHSRGVYASCLLKDGTTFVSAGADQSLRVWDLDSAKLLHSLNQHTGPVHDLAVRPTKEGLPMVASASGDRTIRFWQPTIGRMVRFTRLKSEPLDITWTTDGSLVLAACVDGRTRVIDAETVEVIKTIQAIGGWAYAIAVSPGGDGLAVGGANGQIRRLDASVLTLK